jgi:hypothetical protein
MKHAFEFYERASILSIALHQKESMRRFLLAALAIAPSLAAAQTSPLHTGGWIISGSAGLSHRHIEADDQDETSVSLAPSGLYFVTPRLAVGGSVLLGYDSYLSDWSYGIGPEVRYFIADPTDKLLPFVRASVVPQWQRIRGDQIGGENFTTRLTTVTAAAGLTQIVATHVGVTGEAYVARASYDSGNRQPGSRETMYGLRFGLTIFVH